jgi:hypothetical protein
MYLDDELVLMSLTIGVVLLDKSCKNRIVFIVPSALKDEFEV